ncbi:MAG: hypothetical protein ACXQTD_00935 [Candidatus Syntropharchaeia archaeon]
MKIWTRYTFIPFGNFYKLKENGIRNLILVINSFGGGVSSSFKIAYALWKNFDDITVFVPI